MRLGLRPVVRGRKGGWVRTGISWDKISVEHLRQLGPRPDHVRLLREINLLHSLTTGPRYYSYDLAYPLSRWDRQPANLGPAERGTQRRAGDRPVGPRTASGDGDRRSGGDCAGGRPDSR